MAVARAESYRCGSHPDSSRIQVSSPLSKKRPFALGFKVLETFEPTKEGLKNVTGATRPHGPRGGGTTDKRWKNLFSLRTKEPAFPAHGETKEGKWTSVNFIEGAKRGRAAHL